jgi:hypothetical protein
MKLILLPTRSSDFSGCRCALTDCVALSEQTNGDEFAKLILGDNAPLDKLENIQIAYATGVALFTPAPVKRS